MGTATLTQAKEKIEALWQEYSAQPFPKDLVGKDVAGVDMMSLDTFTAGCVDTYWKRGKLDLCRTAILGLCYRDVGVAVASLNGRSKDYFAQLELLARLVLQAVRDAASKP